MLRVTKDNWVTEFVFVSICQQFLNQTRGNTWISPCLRATKNNIQTLMNIPLPHFFCSDSSNPWEKSSCNVMIAILIWKFRPAHKHQMALTEWGIHLVLPFHVLSTVSVRGTAGKQQTPAGCCLSVTVFSQPCFAVVQRDGRVSAELPTPHQGDFPPASHLWEPVWDVSHSVTRALW